MIKSIKPSPFFISLERFLVNKFILDYLFSGAILLVGSILGICSVCCRLPPEETTKDFVVTSRYSDDVLEREHCDKQKDIEVNYSLKYGNVEDNETSEKELFIENQNST